MNGLRIEKVEVIDCSDLVDPGDDGYIVAVRAAGLTGWYGPISASVGTLLDKCVAPLSIGSPVDDHVGLVLGLRRALGTPIDGLASWALGALDCAVWDLHGRAEARPVAAMLSSAPEQASVPAYASWLRLDIGDPSSAGAIRCTASRGWSFTKWGLRPNPHLDLDAAARCLASLTQQAREAADASVAIDALGSWDEALTLRFAEAVDHAALVWLEEPLASYDVEAYTAVSSACPSLALGERLHLGEDPSPLLNLPRLKAFTIDVVGCGGLTAAVGLARCAAATGVPVFPHGRSLVPAVHLAAAFPEVVAAVEYQVQWEPRRQRLFSNPIECDDGRLLVPRASGLGPIPRRR